MTQYIPDEVESVQAKLEKCETLLEAARIKNEQLRVALNKMLIACDHSIGPPREGPLSDARRIALTVLDS